MCALLASCLNEEGYTTSADARLRLERDTLALDTVLAGEATNTYTFQVFNPQKKTLRIAAIRLAGGAKSPFMVNVDGTFLANGVTGATELAGGDSLRVFVQLNAPASTASAPTPVWSWEKVVHLRCLRVRDCIFIPQHASSCTEPCVLKDKMGRP